MSRSAARLAAPVVAALAASLALSACGGAAAQRPVRTVGDAGTGGPAHARPVSTRTVTIRSFAYHPAAIRVTAGSTVTFVNDDSTQHTATSTSNAFDTGEMKPHDHRVITFLRPGRYDFYCRFHPSMKGVVVVTRR